MKLKHLLEAQKRTILNLPYILKDATGKVQDPYLDDLYLSRENFDGNFSLEHCPNEVRGVFTCENNGFTSLEHCPTIVIGNFSCSGNLLTSLKGCPTTLRGAFACNDNHLTSLEHCPSSITKMFCINNRLTSLKGIHHHIKQMFGIFEAERNPITSHVLGLMKIKGLTYVQLDDDRVRHLFSVQNIINKHLQGNVNGSNLEACADELCEAGFEEYAQL